jgi:hypothetical protein
MVKSEHILEIIKQLTIKDSVIRKYSGVTQETMHAHNRALQKVSNEIIRLEQEEKLAQRLIVQRRRPIHDNTY